MHPTSVPRSKSIFELTFKQVLGLDFNKTDTMHSSKPFMSILNICLVDFTYIDYDFCFLNSCWNLISISGLREPKSELLLWCIIFWNIRLHYATNARKITVHYNYSMFGKQLTFNSINARDYILFCNRMLDRLNLQWRQPTGKVVNVTFENRTVKCL